VENIIEKLIIEPLTPAHTEDYLSFFDNVAFSDNKEWSECYCQFYYYANDDRTWEMITGAENRKNTAESIMNGGMSGYLAYFDGRVAGWCNAGRKTMYARLMNDEKLTGKDDGKIMSIVCYIVAPEFRRKGIARRLLRRICEDAKKEGYEFVEAYPRLGELTCAEHYHGPLELYLRAGFTVYKELGGLDIVRLNL
jgi:GNAT superfamily N-acetyltransferase